ncbi:hypothetical protein ACQKQD_32460 [Methylobacterium sp. NPDC080182]|uniref:hypothetical protein n=1 Tax=Methylobacterium sp. NPDC080182 TaxID=3390590 RepID=UPI003D04C3C8
MWADSGERGNAIPLIHSFQEGTNGQFRVEIIDSPKNRRSSFLQLPLIPQLIRALAGITEAIRLRS